MSESATTTYTGLVYIDVELEEEYEGQLGWAGWAHPLGLAGLNLAAAPAPHLETVRAAGGMALSPTPIPKEPFGVPLFSLGVRQQQSATSPLLSRPRQGGSGAAAAPRKRAPTPHPGGPRPRHFVSTVTSSQPGGGVLGKQSLSDARPRPPLRELAAAGASGADPGRGPAARTPDRPGSAGQGRPLWSGNFAGANEPKRGGERLPAVPRFPATRKVSAPTPPRSPAYFAPTDSKDAIDMQTAISALPEMAQRPSAPVGARQAAQRPTHAPTDAAAPQPAAATRSTSTGQAALSAAVPFVQYLNYNYSPVVLQSPLCGGAGPHAGGRHGGSSREVQLGLLRQRTTSTTEGGSSAGGGADSSVRSHQRQVQR